MRGEELTSTLDLVALGLVLVGQPLGSFKASVAHEFPVVDPQPEEPPIEEPRDDGKMDTVGKGVEKIHVVIFDHTIDEINWRGFGYCGVITSEHPTNTMSFR